MKLSRYALKTKDVFKNYAVILIFGFCILNLIGCATLPPSAAGIYHRVQKGETLWRISKIYDIDLDELLKVNRILDVTTLETGQLIFIPHHSKEHYSTRQYPSHSEDFIWPIKGKTISLFRQTYNDMVNKGINIQPYKSADVVAARSGRVVFYSEDFQGFGKTIIIDHADGFSTVYARNSQVFIRVGENVEKGTLIAKADSYLHFQIRKGHLPQNPYFYLPQRK